jgi:hypothetical protein
MADSNHHHKLRGSFKPYPLNIYATYSMAAGASKRSEFFKDCPLMVRTNNLHNMSFLARIGGRAILLNIVILISFSCVQPPTVIFHLSARYRADTHPKKLNLGVGAYRDEALKPYVFSAVRKAEAAVVAAGFDKEYLPITGYPAFNVGVSARLRSMQNLPQCNVHVARADEFAILIIILQAAAAKLMFGDSSAFAEKRIATCQTLSGTGSLTVTAHLIK